MCSSDLGPRSILLPTASFRGVAVTASNSDDIGAFGVGLGVSGAVAVMTVVVADANPVLEDHRTGRHAGRAINSRNHRGEGQNLLFCDGAVEWSTTPLLQGGPGGMTDNIWLPQDELGRDRMQLRSWPGNAADNFVAQ